MKLSDQQFEAVKESINNTIHELVMACHHAEEDEIESAQECLMTCQGNLETVAAALQESPSQISGN
jgi:predicted RecB family endonuclease